MGDAIGQILSFGVGVAISPVPIGGADGALPKWMAAIDTLS
jgi:hypothetical protein